MGCTTNNRSSSLTKAALILCDPDSFTFAEWALNDMFLPFVARWTWHRVARWTSLVHVNVTEPIFVPSVFANLFT